MKQTALLFILTWITAGYSAIGQTKKIAFESHSGSSSNFKIALEENFFDMDNSNFGLAPERMVTSSELDSVIFVSDSIAVMVTSYYCKKMIDPSPQEKLWRAGRDTVYYHPLFSRQHSLDSIKMVLKGEYYFKN